MKKKQQTGGWAETFRTLVYAILIALVVRTAAFEPFNIPSGSMVPTLLIGDYLFVSKFSYGYSRYSLPLQPPLFKGRVLSKAPERGDVAVFRQPVSDETFIKRIIGLPGDEIQVIAGILHINGVAVKRERIDDYLHQPRLGEPRFVPQYLETLPNGVVHSIIEVRGDTNGSMDDTKIFKVPPGHYFAMGDNRDNSADSRTGWTVPLENFVGPAKFLFFSTDGSAGLLELWRWPGATRFGRLFDGVR